LTWGSGGTGGATYRVYYGTASRAYGQPYGAGLDTNGATTFTVSGLPGGQLYYFSVTAVDASGRESVYSNEATKLVQ
jgi:fibronectin type 3 domain-containing protein